MKTVALLKITPIMALVMGLTSYAQIANGTRSIKITNDTSNPSLTVYMGFNGQSYGCYSKTYFTTYCQFVPQNPYICQLTVKKGSPVPIYFNQSCQVSVAFTSERQPWGACPTSLAEFTLNGSVGGKTQDTVDAELGEWHQQKNQCSLNCCRFNH